MCHYLIILQYIHIFKWLLPCSHLTYHWIHTWMKSYEYNLTALFSSHISSGGSWGWYGSTAATIFANRLCACHHSQSLLMYYTKRRIFILGIPFSLKTCLLHETLIQTYVFLIDCAIPQQLGALPVQTWPICSLDLWQNESWHLKLEPLNAGCYAGLHKGPSYPTLIYHQPI